MNRFPWWNEQTLRAFIVAALSIFILDGVVTTFLFTRPFWVDEWRIIYNLKTRSVPGLWRTLSYLQQFPRLYLSLVRIFTGACDYSYWSLRLPSLIVGIASILLGWRLMRRLYPKKNWLQLLFVMIVVSSTPFTKYFVQVKQYSMDIALSLVAIWQVLELLQLVETRKPQPGVYTILCGSFVLAPFFSYTYPIAIAPAFLLMLLVSFRSPARDFRETAVRWMPLLLCAISIVTFYAVDARHVLADQGMKAFWQYNLASGLGISGIIYNFYSVFAQVGTGYVFQTIFGILGVAGFFWSCSRAIRDLREGFMDRMKWLRLYSISLLMTAAALFLAGKLPLGESRLNAFLTASISMLVIDLLWSFRSQRKAVAVVGGLLYVGVVGNIFTTLIHGYTDEGLGRKRNIYATTGNAIRAAKPNRLPMLVTPGVAYPYEQDPNLPDTSKLPGDWVLKTHPAYRFADSIPVYPVATKADARAVFATLTVDSAIYCDGLSFEVLAKH